MNRNWGMGKDDFAYLSPGEIIENLCACRKVGANYLLNMGPTAAGGIPAYEAAALRRAGDWVRLCGDSIYEGRPADINGQGADFVLEEDGRRLLFVHNLAVAGHGNVTVGFGGTEPRAFSGVTGKVETVRWLDNGEELEFSHDPDSGLLCVNATGYPYGVNLVVRVAELG